jgi:hypothetical protein
VLTAEKPSQSYEHIAVSVDVFGKVEVGEVLLSLLISAILAV